ncbi:MAG: hypothetical protein E7318_08950 [Clostridiales bacterium]|nr:hypothetical protein [Clostridiales bacterium]
MIRRLIFLLCVLMLLMSLPFARGEGTQTSDAESFANFYRIPDTIYYKGGTVLHGYFKGADRTIPPLEIAYALTSSPYIILGEPTFWELYISGGSGNYTCEALLAYQADLSLDPFEDGWETLDYFPVEGDSFEYTFTEPGRYFWAFYVMDDEQFFSFQTRIYETYEATEETDETTVVGKVNSIVSELITEDMSDYTRALVLHDWLIYNANYDYSSNPNYDASGVLLYGTGVCDSYARAYLMLCTAAGLECMIVVGDAGSPGNWGSHAWNLVKLNGSWYHVDCTWDDPGEGGYEYHDYFCVDDETMARDHRWNRPDNITDGEGYIPPDAEGGELENDPEASVEYHFTFSDMDEFNAHLEAMIASGDRQVIIYGKYTGAENNNDFYYSTYKDWVFAKIDELYGRDLLDSAGYLGIRNGLFYITLYWKSAVSSIRIEEASLRLSVGEQGTILPSMYYPEGNVFTWESSDSGVATVSASYTEETGLVATVVGVSSGTATITATSADGYSDSVEVTVLPAHRPDFSLSAATDGSEVILSWETIPGVTEYQVYRRYEGQDTLIGTTAANRLRVSSEKLPSSVSQQVYVVGKRIVSGQTQLQYTSTPISYGRLTLNYAFTLPAALTRIEEEAFEGCTYLTSVKIPGKVTYIGEDAFEECVNLTTIRIPASVRYIGEDAFEDCPLQYAEVSPGSYAEEWLLRHFPDIILVY